MRIGIHALSAKMGGAATYLKNALPELVRELRVLDPGCGVILWHSGLARDRPGWAVDVEAREIAGRIGAHTPLPEAVSRLWFDQITLPRVVRRERIRAVFATANYCSLRPACGQVLLVRNPIPFDEVFLRRMPRQVRLSLGLQRALTIRSMEAADVVFFPTAAMRELVAHWTGGTKEHWRVAHYGALTERFSPNVDGDRNMSRLDPIRLLHVSTYSDQKNIGVLLRATEILSSDVGRSVDLRLTAGFDKTWIGESAGFPRFNEDAAKYREMERRGLAQDVSWTRYEDLPELYRSSHIFVFPSYSESFGHPLVEAMASGLPIVAADTPVNRELCGDAAVYAAPFSPEDFAQQIAKLASDSGVRRSLGEIARTRALQFSWRTHARLIVAGLAATAGVPVRTSRSA